MPKLYTKTFVENSWYRLVPGGNPGDWQKLPPQRVSEEPIDKQVADWVNRTGHAIIHPGQLGMHKEWFEEQTLMCVTLGLTVLYEPNGAPDDYAYLEQRPEPVADSCPAGSS